MYNSIYFYLPDRTRRSIYELTYNSSYFTIGTYYNVANVFSFCTFLQNIAIIANSYRSSITTIVYRIAYRTAVTCQAGSTGITFRTLRTSWTFRANFTLVTFKTLYTLRTLLSLYTLRTLRANGTSRTLWTNGTLSTLRYVQSPVSSIRRSYTGRIIQQTQETATFINDHVVFHVSSIYVPRTSRINISYGCRTLRTLRTSVTFVTLVAFITLRTLYTLYTLRTSWTCFTLRTYWTRNCTVSTIFTR